MKIHKGLICVTQAIMNKNQINIFNKKKIYLSYLVFMTKYTIVIKKKISIVRMKIVITSSYDEYYLS